MKKEPGTSDEEGTRDLADGSIQMHQRKSLVVERIAQEDSKAVIFRLAGKLTSTKECYDFLESVRDDVHGGCTRIVFNLEKIDQVSSPGIGIIAACYTSTTNAGGSITIVAAPQRVGTLLEVVRLWDLFAHYDTEDEALEALPG
ncbi:MAG: STAS domain-containing protein [Candidatus Eisenbacteria sp.]|nr:STAS domain-containing protein [Candidatus Eisenbacteria bacterium]